MKQLIFMSPNSLLRIFLILIFSFLFFDKQFLVAAKDRGTPQRTSDNATVNIQVIRNENAPSFQQATITASINQVL